MTPIRRDETLYSAAARLSRYVGAKGRSALQLAFFGEDGAVFDEMPTGLARIVGSGAFPPIAVADAVREWTLFPYYAHYAEPRRRREAEAVMTGGGGWPHKELCSWTWAAPPPERLRFCRECHDEMLRTAKEPWWRRTHQLPSTLVCPKHGSMLRTSTLDRVTRRRAYVAASMETCPPDASAVAEEEDPRVLHDLLWLAGQGDMLLNDRDVIHPDERRESYLEGLAALDLLNKLGEAKLPGISDAMRRYWGSTLDHWPTLRRDSGVEQGWLHRLLVAEHGSPPLHHLLLEGWLVAVPPGRCTGRSSEICIGTGEGLTVSCLLLGHRTVPADGSSCWNRLPNVNHSCRVGWRRTSLYGYTSPRSLVGRTCPACGAVKGKTHEQRYAGR